MKLTSKNWRLFFQNITSLMREMLLEVELSEFGYTYVHDLYTNEELYYIKRCEGNLFIVSTSDMPGEEFEVSIIHADAYELICLCEALC